MRLHQAGIDELVDDRLAEALDVHGAARGEGAQALLELGRAGRAGAAVEDAVLVRLDRRAADRARRREVEHLLVAGAGRRLARARRRG